METYALQKWYHQHHYHNAVTYTGHRRQQYGSFDTELFSYSITGHRKQQYGCFGTELFLIFFFTQYYSQHTRGTFGVGGLPSGGNYYRACLAWHLSLDMPPAQVHQTGLKEVDRITQLMQQVSCTDTLHTTAKTVNECVVCFQAHSSDKLCVCVCVCARARARVCVCDKL